MALNAGLIFDELMPGAVKIIRMIDPDFDMPEGSREEKSAAIELWLQEQNDKREGQLRLEFSK